MENLHQRNTILNGDELEFFNGFVIAHVAPHSTQTPEQAARRTWTYKRFETYDEAVKSHLAGKESLALPPRWYPTFANIDIDNPKVQEKAVFDKLDELQIRHDQMLGATTPRYRQNGNFRIYFKMEMKGLPATAGLQDVVLKRHFNFHNVETNPRPNVSDRLPYGFGSEFVDIHSKRIIKLNLRGKLDALKSLRPVEISELPYLQAELPEVAAQINPNHLKARGEFLTEARTLYENGLQSGGYGRNDAQHRVIFLLWKSGLYSPEAAAELTKSCIREKHNNLSDAVNSGDWTRIDGEIDRQTAHVFALETSILPDTAHNRTTAATRGDVIMAAKFAPADAVRQKQFFNLLKFIRPVFHWQWITIRADRWRDSIAGTRQYKNFQQDLEAKGLMVANRQYVIGSQSRKYQFNFNLDDGAALTDAAGRNIDSYEEALVTAFNGNGREIKAVTGINNKTIKRYVDNVDKSKPENKTNVTL